MSGGMPQFRIARERLEDQIAGALREAIISGTLSPGKRLVEEELADQFGVSRAPLREALKELAAAGLVINIPHRGTFVVELTERDIWEIYTLRLALESIAVELLVGSVTPEQVESLNSLIDQMDDALGRGDSEAVVDLDMQLHEAICLFCGHRRLYESWSRVADQLRSFFAAADQLYEDRQITERHRELVAAIASGDKARAIDTIREHISNAANLLHSMGMSQHKLGNQEDA